MKILVEKEVCGSPIKNHGLCDKPPQHTGSHSSAELRKYRKDATAKSRAKNKATRTFSVIDDSILDNDILDDGPDVDVADEVCACGHTYDTCPNSKYCGLTPKQIEDRKKDEAERAAREEERIRRLAQQADERQFLTSVLDKYAAGEIIDPETQKRLLEVCRSYLFSGDEDFGTKFRLTHEERINRGFGAEGIARLSSALYGEEYTGIGEPRVVLDEKSFPVRLGHFLGAVDLHGSRNVSYHPEMQRKVLP